jgi:hypothetical protein
VDANCFEFSLTVPRDARFAQTVRELAVQAATYAGCGESDVETFAASVEQAVLASLAGAAGSTSDGAPITVVMRRDAGPVEVRIDGRTLTVEP